MVSDDSFIRYMINGKENNNNYRHYSCGLINGKPVNRTINSYFPVKGSNEFSCHAEAALLYNL